LWSFSNHATYVNETKGPFIFAGSREGNKSNIIMVFKHLSN